jgi:hypothetical protein
VTVYRGVRELRGGVRVTVDGRTLDPRADLVNHSPDGFEWGYGGSGPAQLALAILADHFGPGCEQDALAWYQDFKWQVVAKLPRDSWTLLGAEILAFLEAFPAGRV